MRADPAAITDTIADKKLKIVKKAIAGNWSPERFQARLQDTKWFKKHSDIWRQNTALKYTDPQTYKERLKNYRTQIKNLAGQWGADLTQRELGTVQEQLQEASARLKKVRASISSTEPSTGRVTLMTRSSGAARWPNFTCKAGRRRASPNANERNPAAGGLVSQLA